MLVYFRAENFRSIKQPVELDLRAASRLRRLKHHVRTPIKNKSLRVLKSAILYGANASGKSNILKAIRAAQQMVTEHVIPNTPIAAEPFALTDDINPESSFYFEFVLLGGFWGFSVRFNKDRIIEESLTQFQQAGEVCIYSRRFLPNEGDSDNYQISSAYAEEHLPAQEVTEFQFLVKYTPKNRLFIAECEERGGFEKLNKIGQHIQAAYNFFKLLLVVTFPETKYEGFCQDKPYKTEGETPFTQLLKQFDTGVDTFTRVEVNVSIFPASLITAIAAKMLENRQNLASFYHENTEYCATINNDQKLSFYRVNTVHKLPSGSNTELELNQESDGTLRLLDLLPTITQKEFGGQPFTFIIDEFDRSLHPNLAKSFLELFLNSDHADNNNQLILSTHEVELLDNDLLRRDEIWFVQKQADSTSSLYCLNDYSTRFDKDIHKAYLSGKFGAVPQFVDDDK